MAVFVLAMCVAACHAGSASGNSSEDRTNGQSAAAGRSTTQSILAPAGTYKLLAWSELGMHCMDGKDYSIFAVLPPYNIVHAQLIKMGEPPQTITTGVTVIYEATADTAGSINTISSTKTNFWSYIRVLFLNSNPPDVGLTGNHTQDLTPRKLSYDSKNAYWTANGIPTVPYDDQGRRNPYGMAKIVARDGNGNILASAKIVLSVSDEMTCSKCHASNSDPYAKPASGWENDKDPLKDVKLNILKKHDDRFTISQYLLKLEQMGYVYQSSLYQTAKSGTPILCASCHSTNALGLAGISGIRSMTSAMHTLHGPVLNLDTGKTLDQATSSLQSCYLCHPGLQTRCERGAMHKTECFDCHGNLTHVGNQNRRGWLDLPACQMCHTNSKRYSTTFDTVNHWRVSTDPTFATNKNKPIIGTSLYRYSTGHGQLYCSGCHGSPHAEFPTLQANDNVYSQALQGHTGKIAECTVCHTQPPVTANGGPHKVHTVGQAWVDSHHDYVERVGLGECAYCHGSDFRGSFLSKTSMVRSFDAGDYGTKTYKAGEMVTCYDCHNGPDGG
jgi:hypothetical protein